MTRTPVIAVLLAFVAPAVAGELRLCGARPDLLAAGAAMDQEPIAGGRLDERQVLEIWASPDGGRWSLVVTDVSGESCLVTTGTRWRPPPAGLPAEPAEPAPPAR